ncbi:MAG: DUF4040 domain-containing protein [Elainella sp. Prado103]|jgi:uncharacterized MnhB-related membrane protein|nr:DUF4040 domain-containing protein [Elainella sp. Prado103]
MINFEMLNAAFNLDPSNSYLYLIALLLPLSAAMVVFQTNPYHALVIRGILGAMAALVYALFGAADVALTEALVGTMLAITLYAVAVRSSMVMRLGVLEEGFKQVQALQAHPKPSLQTSLTKQQFSDPFVVALPSTAAESEAVAISDPPVESCLLESILNQLRSALNKYHMRLELVPYKDYQALHQALIDQEVHAACANLETPAAIHSSRDEIGQGAIGRGEAWNQADYLTAIQAIDPTTTQIEYCSGQRYHLATRVHRLYEILHSELTDATTSLSYVNLLHRQKSV